MDSQADPPNTVRITSRTASRIQALNDVDADITRLLSLASSAISLLTLTQTDEPGSTLPQGEERSEQFVLEISEYFELLDQIHINMRSTLGYMRQSRIAPAVINAPAPAFIPQFSGTTLPPSQAGVPPSQNGKPERPQRGYQEERMDREAWKAMLEALKKLKAAREQSNSMDVDTKSKE